MNQADDKTPHAPSGLARRLLKLLVEVDSSRFVTTRLGAGIGLLAMLALFGAAGYWLPALLAHYLAK